MNIQIAGLVGALGDQEDALRGKAIEILGVAPECLLDFHVIRRSLDARRHRPPRFVYIVSVSIPDDVPVKYAQAKDLSVRVVPEAEAVSRPSTPVRVRQRPIVIGFGPAGLFAALTLALRGIDVLVLERGKPVPERVRDVEAFWSEGVLDGESHVHFGEGGAGTFSDGKLTTRVKNPQAAWVKRVLVDAGAPSDILTDAKPHIGTDRLRGVIINLRKKLLGLGSEVRFGARMTDLVVCGGRAAGVVVNGEEMIPGDHLVLAIGQGAEDTYGLLVARGVRMIPKPFALGLRVEHPQGLIDAIQYGKWAGQPELPPADYSLTARAPGMDRSVYTFCMCPGGQVIGCSSRPGEVVTNGMSRRRRDGLFANSALVVTIRPEDFGGGEAEPLAGLAFRRRWEEAAFVLGGGNYWAPAQRLVDFLEDREGDLGTTTFLPGVTGAPLQRVLPPFVTEALKGALPLLDRKMRGFVTAEAHLIGVETRTSAPLRILRGDDGASVNVAGLFPCGEGAGYAGGIISSALDGIRAAEALIRLLGGTVERGGP